MNDNNDSDLERINDDIQPRRGRGRPIPWNGDNLEDESSRDTQRRRIGLYDSLSPQIVDPTMLNQMMMPPMNLSRYPFTTSEELVPFVMQEVTHPIPTQFFEILAKNNPQAYQKHKALFRQIPLDRITDYYIPFNLLPLYAAHIEEFNLNDSCVLRILLAKALLSDSHRKYIIDIIREKLQQMNQQDQAETIMIMYFFDPYFDVENIQIFQNQTIINIMQTFIKLIAQIYIPKAIGSAIRQLFFTYPKIVCVNFIFEQNEEDEKEEYAQDFVLHFSYQFEERIGIEFWVLAITGLIGENFNVDKILFPQFYLYAFQIMSDIDYSIIHDYIIKNKIDLPTIYSGNDYKIARERLSKLVTYTAADVSALTSLRGIPNECNHVITLDEPEVIRSYLQKDPNNIVIAYNTQNSRIIKAVCSEIQFLKKFNDDVSIYECEQDGRHYTSMDKKDPPMIRIPLSDIYVLVKKSDLESVINIAPRMIFLDYQAKILLTKSDDPEGTLHCQPGTSFDYYRILIVNYRMQ